MFILFNLITLNRESTLWLTKKMTTTDIAALIGIFYLLVQKKNENCKLATLISVKNVQES